MQLSIVDGELSGCTQIESPNSDQRANPQNISLLVIHGISLPPGEFGGPHVQQLFTNNLDKDAHPYFAKINDLRVSAHLFINRQGEIFQFVNFNRRAWHAGESSWCGQSSCNDYSLGIELEGTDYLAYTDAQYDSLAAASRAILQAYPDIDTDRIVGHSDIAPGRKTDPGMCFDWHRFLSSLESKQNSGH